MKLIIGLGNPGKKYQNTRHNVGYLFIDTLRKSSLPGGIIAKKSGVYMNNSGPAVSALCTKYNLQNTNLYIIHDDLDLPLGQYKIQLGIGPKLHYGIQSIDKALGSKDYWRIRVGVDNRDSEERISGEEYVLQNFTEEEKEVINKVIKNIIDEKLF